MGVSPTTTHLSYKHQAHIQPPTQTPHSITIPSKRHRRNQLSALGGSQARLLTTTSQRSQIQSVVIICQSQKTLSLNPMSKIFISYSHKDEVWKDRLQEQLGALALEGYFSVWDDRQIKPGDDWFAEIERALNQADVAVMLISASFLTSTFIRTEEIPTLLLRREQEGMRLIPLIVRPCAWQKVTWLSAIQGAHKDNQPLSKLNKNKREEALAELTDKIASFLKDNPTPQTTILSDRLPTVAGKFFGRERELQLLDDAWRSEQTNIVEFIASGGTGKTKLLRHWLDRSLADKAMGINALIAWSFYSQGASEDNQVSSSDFFAHAFAELGSQSTDFPTDEARGEHLAKLLRQHRCLLILDGLEPLQHASAANRGELKDRALRQMLRTLALDNQGLCVITTRIAVHELSDRQSKVVHHNLDNLQTADAVKLFKHLQVEGSDKELQAAAQDYGCHALSVSLLGNLLHRRYSGDIRKRDLIPELFDPKSASISNLIVNGRLSFKRCFLLLGHLFGLVKHSEVDKDSRHAFKVMQAYERWFSSEQQYSAELALLRLLGLFDHPIELSVLEILQQEQIPQLTQGIKPNAWDDTIATLRDDHHLLAQANDPQDEQLDCHPLIRAYFAHRLRSQSPDAWQAAHSKLYDYYKNLPSKEQPDNLEEMQPLFRAVAHGCAAGLHQQALEEVYWPRIQRSGEYYLPRKLGAFSDDLATLAHFFAIPWDTPAAGLTVNAQAVTLNLAGAWLRALGRLREAQQPMQAGEEIQAKQKDWKNAASAANNLSELQLTLGEVESAVASAERSVAHADRFGDLFERMVTRTTHADALHQYGEQDAALALFQAAEELQKQLQPQYPCLYSAQGFQYCDLLLALGESQQVLQRAQQTLIWAKQAGGSLLDIALDRLSLGRAHLHQQQLTPAQQHLDQAVDGLRTARTQHHLPRGLLARAELYRQQSNYKQAEKDLQEVFEIAERGEMRLFLCDYHLAMAKLLRTRTDQDQNQPAITHHLQTAEKIIHQTHYHRCLPELNQLLATSSQPASTNHS